jgi:chromosome segregation ATPase
VAEDQHSIIETLRQKLSKASTKEEKDAIINDLSHQLDQQTRYVQESETCIKLLEDELSNALDKINQLEDNLQKADSKLSHIPNMQCMIQQFTEESKDMLHTLASLEQENNTLLSKLNSSDSNSSSATVDKLQKELLSAQQEYAELEERYLELRMQQ